MSTHIITVTDEKKYKGDWASAVAVGAALLKEIQNDVDLIALDGEETISIDDRLHGINAENDTFIVTAGVEHAEFLANIEGTNIVKILSAHQLSDTIKSVARHFNFVALPGHALSSEQKAELSAQTNLIETLGVPHMVTEETLSEAYDKRIGTDPKFAAMMDCVHDEQKGFQGVNLLVLSGDAPDALGAMKHYLPEEAGIIALAAMQTAYDSDGYLAITNGPRTGKFDPETGQETKAHRHFTDMDPVTAATRAALLRKGFIEGQDFDVWDFRFLDKGVDSAYQALLGAAHRTGGIVHMPGESTSMVTEAADILKRPFVVYEAGSMSDTHYAHMRAVHEAGQAHVLMKMGVLLDAPEMKTSDGFVTDAQRIASTVLARPRP